MSWKYIFNNAIYTAILCFYLFIEFVTQSIGTDCKIAWKQLRQQGNNPFVCGRENVRDFTVNTLKVELTDIRDVPVMIRPFGKLQE